MRKVALASAQVSAQVSALVSALATAAALSLQLVLVVNKMTGEGASVAGAVWRYLGFFTILSNLAVAMVAGAMALAPASRLAAPLVRMVVLACIVFVAIVYSVALRATWAPQGWQAVADHALHDVTPPLFALAWLLADHGGVRWRDMGWVLLAPLGYCIYAFVRGSVDGWYAYWFLNPATTPPAAMTGNVAILLAAFLALAAALFVLDGWLARRATQP